MTHPTRTSNPPDSRHRLGPAMTTPVPEPVAVGDAELDTLIRTRLALVGVDLTQLPTEPDPATGSPTQAQAYASLRTFLAGPLVDGVRQGGALQALARWTPPAPSPELAQQEAAPSLYPSITAAWTEQWPVRR
ncbi:hypothetical protein EDC03_2992 [Pseudokineococcus lusitanus]|uniref:Uncharacterized protein n=2 Tax=Pseudokineococcus lusitanus TaxID=763993 RepID=A0A3N1GA18_9ACTN|nr:hypothetical protein EDC03_2992 [Pseudokineococcus lusitanus]